ncbi:MAG TPA: MBL fold metallo-hydrolase [Verrucomicrobiae bacterium]|jgi:glyoxylase-like metal-dependent hydrolase (beta-lactamase superfamily II)
MMNPADSFFLKRYFVEGLAHASYLFGADGAAAVVDPKRDVDDYLADAERAGLKIAAVFNTHPHADFASGFCEIAARTGAKVYTSHAARASYDHVPARDGQRVSIGSLEVEVLETPGHSPDSLSFLTRQAGCPVAVFTGDLLFVGDVGRPDLRDADADPGQLADMLYDSLFSKILSLPADVKVHPAHGAGSLCGRALGSAPFTTVEQEKQFNWAAQLANRAEFRRQMLANLPERPAYFGFDVSLNLRGAAPWSELPPLRVLEEGGLARDGVVVIDTRAAPLFGAGHFPGSINIGLGSAMFATWSGFFVAGESRIALAACSADAAAKARLALARIGFDNVIGWLETEEFQKAQQLSQLSVHDLQIGLSRGDAPLVLDVRTAGEWQNGHIEGARHIPLPALPRRMAEVPRDRSVAVICAGGYRSSIAASLLARAGWRRVANVMGGMSAYHESYIEDWQAADLVFAGEYI